MRTKEYDVNLTGRRLSIVRLKDGAVVEEAEIPDEATDAVVEVLTAKEDAAAVKVVAVENKPKKTSTKKTTTKKTADDGSVQTA